jgi:hypothetical protein
MTATANRPHLRPRTAVLVLLLAVLGAAFGAGLAVLYSPPALAAPAPAQPVALHRIDAIPAAAEAAADVDPLLAVAFGPGADVTDDQAAEVRLTADRVCEGLADGTPVAEMTATLMQTTGMLPQQARAFVNTADCGTDRR